MQDFRNLDAWHKAHALAIDVHQTLARNKRVDAHMRSQLSKAARSIAGCLVEGCGKDEYRILLGRDVGYFNASDHDRITGKTVEVRRMLFGLRKGIRNKRRKTPQTTSDPPTLPDP